MIINDTRDPQTVYNQFREQGYSPEEARARAQPISYGGSVRSVPQNAESNYQSQVVQPREAERARGQSAAELSQLQQQFSTMAEQYKRNLPEYQKGLVDIASQSNRKQLATKMQSISQDLNSRGLISGGIAEGKAAKAQSESEAQLNQQKADIEKQVAGEADDFRDYATNFGISTAGQSLENQNQLYRDALESLRSRNQALSQLGGAVGTIAGSAIANRNKT